MAINLLSDAADDLLKYFASTGRDDIISLMTKASAGDSDAASILNAANIATGGTANVSSTDVETVSLLQQALCDTTEGAFFTSDILNTIGSQFDDDGGDDIKKLVRIYFEKDAIKTQKSFFMDGDDDSIKNVTRSERMSTDDGISNTESQLDTSVVNESTSFPDRFKNPTLSAFVFPSLRMGIPTRNTDSVSLFSNAIPTIEMSRCVPFINLRFMSVVPSLLGERTRQLSLLRFLGMNTKNDPNDGIGMNDALPDNGSINEFFGTISAGASGDALGINPSVSSAGMELFTSPQTLINADINRGDFSGRAGSVLDPFKPLMTLDSINIKIEGLGRALLSSKTAVVNITLHDRSRLADIAPIVAIDLFGTTNVMIEWGWNHPEGGADSRNPIGKFLNSMKTKNLFHTVSSNYSMGNDGTVKISLRLASRGGTDSINVPVATGNVVPVSIFKPLLTSILSKKLQDATDSSDDQSREIRQNITVNLRSAASTTSVVSRDLFKEFHNIISPQPDQSMSIGTDALTEVITKLIGEDGNGGELISSNESNKSIASELKAKITALRNKDATDPFLPDERTIIDEISPGVRAGLENDEFVSLGKLIMSFVGYPLAASGRFDETQVIFYRFNSQSAAARRFDISQFVINIERFRIEMLSQINKNPSMTVSSFFTLIREFISNPSNINYGLTALYKRRSEISSNKNKESQEEIKIINSEIETRLKEIYTSDNCGTASGEFRIPNIKFYMDSLPARTFNSTGSETGQDSGKIILRIHIFDQSATPHEDQLFLLSALNDSEIASLVKGADSAISEMSSLDAGIDPGQSRNALSHSQDERHVDSPSSSENATDYNMIISKTSPETIKRLIRQTVPNINFGSQFTAIKSVSLSANTGGAVGDALLLNSLISKESQTAADVPTPMEDIKVIPASLRVTMLGCPIIEYGQQFFFDLNTGTTADNLYTVTNINHTLSSGKFDTSFDLTFVSNGTIRTFRNTLASALPKLRSLSANSDT
ncbi:hypothetical protein CMI47_08180 [Candidatus Pacearchaeota archaeon]|nr:hypothetical protein [Candidatus Pacearchaeota archaeon]